MEKSIVFEPVFLLSAARRGEVGRVREMVEIARYPVDVEGDEGYTALHVACLKGHVETVALLVSFGADVFHKNEAEQSPLSAALNRGAEVLDALMGRQLVRYYYFNSLFNELFFGSNVR